ncbi:MAG: hypothetical protein RBT73_08090, partial [Spirochaetia bacterium]|nr:hypothetical protein [Spirochaetia bacterium]
YKQRYSIEARRDHWQLKIRLERKIGEGQETRVLTDKSIQKTYESGIYELPRALSPGCPRL